MVAPDPVAFTIFGIDVMWYGVLIGSAMLLACGILCFRAKERGIDTDRLLNVLIISLPAGIIGARLYYVAFEWDKYAGDIMKMINIRGGGLAIIFGITCAVILCLKWKLPVIKLLDLAAPVIALAQSIGRWGNFFNEEAHGGPTDFPINVLIDGQTYHATFLYESIWCFALFIVLMIISDRMQKFDGQIFLLYGMLYSAERFLVEGLRTDSLMIGPFRQAQVFSLAVIAVCGILYIAAFRRNRARNIPAGR